MSKAGASVRGKLIVGLDGLQFLRGSKLNTAIRKAISEAGVPVKAAVVRHAPKDLGFLKESIRIRSRFYKGPKTWVAVVGPSSSFTRTKRRKVTPRPTAKQKRRAKQKARAKKAAKQAKRQVAKTVKAGVKKFKLGRKLLRRLNKVKARRPKPAKPPKAKKRKRRKYTPKKVRPARYAHLANWGAEHMAGAHFLEAALRASKGQFDRIIRRALARRMAEIAGGR